MLYPNYKPTGIKPQWDHTSLCREDAAKCLARHFGRAEVPAEAVAWWDDDGNLRRLIADYADGRRADLKINKAGYRISHTSPGADA